MTVNGSFFEFRIRPIACSLLMVLLSSIPLRAFQTDLEPRSFEDRLATLWENYLQAKAIGDENARKAAFDAFRIEKESAPGEIFEAAGHLFMEEGFKDLRSRRYDNARREFLNAAEMNPHLWPAFNGLAHIKKEREGNFWKYLDLNRKGLLTAFQLKNSFFMLDALVWFLRNLYWVIMLGMTLFTLILCFKYLRPFLATMTHSWEHRGVSPAYAKAFAFILLLLPLLLGFNYYLAAFLYLVLFFPFFDARERGAATLVFLSSILLIFLNLVLSNINYARSDPLLRAHLLQYLDGNYDQQIEFLKEQPGKGGLQNRSLFTIGMLYKAKGDYRQAMEIFEQVPPRSKFWPLAQVNRGNIEFLAKEYQKARESYKKALGRNPNLGKALYNLSLVSAKLGNHDEAETYRSQAAEKDPGIKSRIALYEGLGGGSVLDALPGYRERLAQAILGQNNPIAVNWFRQKVFLIPALLGLALLAAAAIHARARNTHLLARGCEKCGRIYFPNDSPNSVWCSQCVNLYIKKDDLPSSAKMKKHEEVSAFTKREHQTMTVLQVLFPGAKKILQGSAFAGLFALVVWTLLIVFSISPITDISYPFMRFIKDDLFRYLALTITLVYWVIFGILPIWQED